MSEPLWRYVYRLPLAELRGCEVRANFDNADGPSRTIQSAYSATHVAVIGRPHSQSYRQVNGVSGRFKGLRDPARPASPLLTFKQQREIEGFGNELATNAYYRVLRVLRLSRGARHATVILRCAAARTVK